MSYLYYTQIQSKINQIEVFLGIFLPKSEKKYLKSKILKLIYYILCFCYFVNKI
nr:MAG TPA: hypothetical protein [Caudoviricetes sp.]